MLLALFALFAVASAQTTADCTQFCNDYNTTCLMLLNAPANDIYSTMQACMDECMKYPMDSNCPDGSDATMCASGNSYGCRRYHLNVAMMANASDTSLAVTHCPHTTPLSSPTSSITATDALTGTVCKTMINGTTQNGLVADFCNQVVGACSAYLSMTQDSCNHFYSMIGGNTDVTNYPDGTTRKFPIAATTGSGLPCRRYHVQVARTQGNAAEHCPHALMGAGGCGSTCETYCAMGMAICPSMFDAATCESKCASDIPAAVDYTVITNKDIVCRIYHLSVASTSAAAATTHCPHTTIESTPDTCGSSASTASFSALLIAALALITKFSS